MYVAQRHKYALPPTRRLLVRGRRFVVAWRGILDEGSTLPERVMRVTHPPNEPGLVAARERRPPLAREGPDPASAVLDEAGCGASYR